MDLCAVFLVLLVVVAIVTFVGHGFWLLIAAFFRLFTDDGTRRRREADAVECPGCGRFNPPWKEKCPSCGLAASGALGRELADLDTTYRQLKQFVARGALDRAFLERVGRVIAEQRRRLCGVEEPQPVAPAAVASHPEPVLAVPAAVAPRAEPVVAVPAAMLFSTRAVEVEDEPAQELTPDQQLEEVLARCQTIGDLTPAERSQALQWYRQNQAPALSAKAHMNLAELLVGCGMTVDALRAYRRFLTRFVQAPEFAASALRAGRLAIGQERTEDAAWFLERALSAGTLGDIDRQAAQVLLQRLRPVTQEIPEVIVVEEAAPVTMPAAESRREHAANNGPAHADPSPSPVAAAKAPVRRAPAPLTPPQPPKPPRRPFTEMLAAFMEERNILWGEILGGLLIVGCSIALVISLWSQVEKIPYFPFVIFGTINVALFGAGLYTLHHWKLESTSRGLLVIATLLVPLNFLILSGLHRDPTGNVGDLLIELAISGSFLALFIGLMKSAATVLLPDHRWMLVLGVLGTSVCQLLVAPLSDPLQPMRLDLFVFLGALPALCQGLSVSRVLRRSAQAETIEPDRARHLLAFLGLASFALAVSLGFVAYRNQDLLTALHRMAVLVALAGMPLLAGGLLVERRVREDAGAVRTTGSAVSLAGMALMLFAVVLAWPQPVAVVLVCVLNFIVLTGTAFRWQLPMAHGAALPCLALGYLTAFHGIVGNLHDAPDALGLVQVICSSRSGTALTFLVVVLGLTAAFIAPIGLRAHAAYYAVGSGIAALVSLGIVTWQGAADPLRAIIVYAIYGTGALVLNGFWRRPPVSYAGLGLLLGATLWWLHWQYPDRWPVWAAIVASEALVFSALRARGRRQEAETSLSDDPRPTTVFPLPAFLAEPLGHAAVVAGVLAILLGIRHGWLGAGSWAFEHPALHAYTLGSLAGTAFLLAGAYRHVGWTWAGSFFVLGGLVHLLAWEPEQALVARLGLSVALVLHATLIGVISVVVEASGGRQPPEDAPVTEPSLGGLTSPARLTLNTIFAMPLLQSALATSVLAVPLLLVPQRAHMPSYALTAGWLAAFWLLIACVQRWPELFAAFQSAVCVAVVYGVTAWLEGQPWVAANYPEGLFDPRSLHAYGIGLAVLSLIGVTLRMVVGKFATTWETMAQRWPLIDRVLPGALVLGQLSLAIWCIAPEVLREYTPVALLAVTGSISYPNAFGTGAWTVLALLAGTLTMTTWRRPAEAVRELVLIAVTVPILIAGPLGALNISAVSLCWGLGTCFLAGSALLWLRQPLRYLTLHLGVPLDVEDSLSSSVRPLLVSLCVAPVLALTATSMFLHFSGVALVAPAVGTTFSKLGPLGTHLVTLGLVAAALVGHALRERSASYAFAAGLVVNLTVIGSYALHVVAGGHPFGWPEAVRLVQWGSSTAAVWALLWLTTRRWLLTWVADSAQPSRRVLMAAQLGLVTAGNALLLIGGALSLAGTFPNVLPNVTQVYYPSAPWAAEVGSLLGWITLALAVGAVVYRGSQQQTFLDGQAFGWIGLGSAILLACSIERWTYPGWGYRTLMLGSAAAALGAVLALSWLAALRASTDEGTSSAPNEATLTGVVAAALLAVLLGLKAAVWHNDHLWAAGAILLASAACAATAVWRRRESWAFVAGLGINLAASLIVWHYQLGNTFDDWWFYLLQANSAAGGATALLWLGARKRFYGTAELRFSVSPLLAVQIVLSVLGNLPTLGLAALVLVVTPDPGLRLFSIMAEFGMAGGWLGLLLPTIAALWYTAQATPRSRLPLAVALGLGFGVLCACTACRWDTTGDWVAFHVLTVAWSMLGGLTLALGLVSVAMRLAQNQSAAALEEAHIEPAPPSPALQWLMTFPEEQVQRWVGVIGWLVVILALRGAGATQGGAYWSPGTALTVAVMAVGMALWARKARYVYQSGLLFNLVGNLFLLAHGPWTAANFVAVNILCLAFGSAFWSAVELALKTGALAFNLRGRSLPFNHLAAMLSLGGLTVFVFGFVSAAMAEPFPQTPGILTWAALAVTGVAVLLGFWDRETSSSTGGLYHIGLLAIALLLCGHEGSSLLYPGPTALALAAYTFLTAALALLVSRIDLVTLLRLPERSDSANASWLVLAEALTALVVVVLSLWLSLNGWDSSERLIGPLAVVLLMPAGILLTRCAFVPSGSDIRHATLVLGVIVVAELGWALLPTNVPALWLHRNVLLMMAAALLAGTYSLVRSWLPEDWATATRRLTPLLVALASMLLLIVLGQEALAYNPAVGVKRAPTQLWAVVVIGGGLVAMISSGLRYALRPDSDPFGLPEKRRTLYVYGAEVFLALLFVHLKLTVGLPMSRHWPLTLMVIAFAGVGLSELFKRRGVPVLAEPLHRTSLFLPVLPVLAIWLAPGAEVLLPTVQAHVPGAEPLLVGLTKVPQEFDKYALIWLLTGILYSLAALSRQSLHLAVMAGLAANFALWSLWRHTGMAFLVHPQLWLIPVALILLLAEYRNRERLSPAQSQALRYGSLGLIYLSSTADMFIAGLGKSLWLPLVLMVLSILGVLLGILLRVRAYLYLGVGFLCLVIFSMIWHAAYDRAQTWVWWASGIVLGVAILTLFAVLEKRRNDVRLMIEQFKQWR